MHEKYPGPNIAVGAHGKLSPYDASEEDAETREKKTYTDSEVMDYSIGSDLNFDDLLSSDLMKSKDSSEVVEISKQTRERSQANKSVFTESTTEVKVLYSRNGDPEESLSGRNNIPEFDRKFTERKYVEYGKNVQFYVKFMFVVLYPAYNFHLDDNVILVIMIFKMSFFKFQMTYRG